MFFDNWISKNVENPQKSNLYEKEMSFYGKNDL